LATLSRSRVAPRGSAAPIEPATRLSRQLTTRDAIVVGLGSMIGAGVFSAVGPAARAAGNAVLVSLLVAAVLAYCNATSSASLAALYPESGGAYVYGRRRLGHLWGALAGWAFVLGKVASCAAMALTFGRYVAPSFARPLAILAVVALTTVNTFGVRKTVGATRAIVAVVLLALAVTLVAALVGGQPRAARLWPLDDVGARAILRGAGFLFFAFAGYARIATLGEEVVEPARTIPRAIPAALGIALLVYAAVVTTALAAAGADVLATSPAPLADAVRAGTMAPLAFVVRVGAAVASLGVLLSLLVGVSRTAFAMASQRDLPAWLAAVHPRHRVPHRAELVVGAAVVALLAFVDLGDAIGFSSFSVLLYYAITNAAALTLTPAERRWPRPLALLGLAGCLVVAASLAFP
jgi:APA family basic amino acid/polyamine antiporter